MVPPAIVQWARTKYPRPQVDPEWLEACYAWATEELNPNDLPEITAAIETQLLMSDLTDSMIHGTGLPPNVSEISNTRLSGAPILVQITAITEIGHSAFSLQTTRQARIDRTDMTTEVAETAEEEEGPVSKYPRSMLKLALSDGATTLQAIEYRTLPELALGETPLGYKMLLKDVSIRRGIAFLEPNCVALIGHKEANLEAMQDVDFARSLRERLGQPEPEQLDQPQPPQPPQPPPPAAAAHMPLPGPRSPLQELPETAAQLAQGPSRRDHADDEDQPRRRRVPNLQSSASSTLAPSSVSSTLVPSSNSPTLVQSSYFSSGSASEGLSSSVSKHVLRLSPVRTGPILTGGTDASRGSSAATSAASTRSFKENWGMTEEEALALEEEWDAAQSRKRKGKAKAPAAGNRDKTVATPPADDGSSDFGEEPISMTASFLDALDRVEMRHLGSGGSSQPAPSESAPSPASNSGPHAPPAEVIVIEDDDEDDKENVPLPTRHVRRRVEPPSSQRRPVILSQPEDVIDLSD